MKVRANTDNGTVILDTALILQFWAVTLKKTAVEHKTNGDAETVVVNHDMQTIMAAILIP